MRGVMIDTERLISEVEKRKHLWDASHEQYKNRELRHKAWQEITSKIVADFDRFTEGQQRECVENVQKRWKTARDAYMKSRNKLTQKKCGTSVTKFTKYIYHDQLTFLDRLEMEQTGCDSYFSPDVAPQDMDENDSLAENSREDFCQIETDDNVQFQIAEKCQGKMPNTRSVMEDNLLNLLKDAMGKEDDDDRAFLTSLLPFLKSLNLDQKLIFRSQTLQLIMALRSGEMRKNTQLSNSSTPFFYPSTSLNCGASSASQQTPKQKKKRQEQCRSENGPSPVPSSSFTKSEGTL